MVCRNTLLTCTSSRCTGLCLAKLSKSCTISFVRCVSCKIICKSSRADTGTSGFSSSKSVNPRIAASGLFTSCATPETSRPIVAIFSLCASLACSVVVVMTDITDAALLQAKLAHSEKMATIGRLVSGVAHEVNNPLAAILGFTDLLLENPEVPGSAREDLQIILQETQRTKDIVQDLLSFARQRPVQRELVQVNSVLRQTIKLRSYDFASHGGEVVV